MKQVDALARLGRLPSIFTTREAAGLLRIDPRHASVVLGRLAEGEHEHVIRLSQGRWALTGRVSRLSLPEGLTRPVPSYVSLQSALQYHGMIEQIPEVIYAVSLAPTRRIATPLGTVSLHHMTPEFFFGFERLDAEQANMATPEKALLDFFYLYPARSRRFRSLPELELPRSFSARRARTMLQCIRSDARRALVRRLLDEAVAGRR